MVEVITRRVGAEPFEEARVTLVAASIAVRPRSGLAGGGPTASTEAAGWLARAVETARRQGASLWEARALDRQARLSTAP